MVGKHAVRNGTVILTEEAVLPVTSREVQYGFSTYEALRVVARHPVHLEDHLVRLDRSCRGIGLRHSFSPASLADWVASLIEVDDLDEASVRILIVGGPVPLCFITASPLLVYPDRYYQEGVSVITYRGERLMPSCKTGNLLLNYMALEKARSIDCFEALLVDRHGAVLEGTRSNFFAFRDSVLHTAPDDAVLLGVTRDRVRKAADLAGIRIAYDAPLVTDILEGRYDELFLSSTSMAALPVNSVDGHPFPGSHARTLAICKQVRAWESED